MPRLDAPAVAGVVRQKGVDAMPSSELTEHQSDRYSWWSATFLALALVFPHAGALTGLDAPVGRTLAFLLAWTAGNLVGPRLIAGIRAEARVLGVALGFLFLALNDGAQWPNSMLGPLFILLSGLTAAYARRGQGTPEEPAPRLDAFVLVLASAWATIMVVRILADVALLLGNLG